MQPVLLDSSVYITGLRRGRSAVLSMRRYDSDRPVWLSAVVLEELYAGAAPDYSKPLEQLERDFQRINRLLVPNLGDWTRTGKILAQLAADHDYEAIGRARLTNDALIAMSAARLGILVLTANERDFRRLAAYRPFQWQVISL